jgi:hypothetical protein
MSWVQTTNFRRNRLLGDSLVGSRMVHPTKKHRVNRMSHELNLEVNFKSVHIVNAPSKPPTDVKAAIHHADLDSPLSA